MGLTKQYLRYKPYSVFSVVGSHIANVVNLNWKGQLGKFAAVAACEHVFIWDLRKGERVAILEGGKHEVTKLAKSPDNEHLAVGYSDGAVRIFNIQSGESEIVFSGHKSSVTALNYDTDGMRLVSGSKDTEVIVWDIVSESGLFRLRGHKGIVTQAKFLSKKNVLITSAKDTFVKFWDLETQHCFKTLVQHRTEVWDFVLCSDESRLVTGSMDMELRVWKLTYDDFEIEAPAAKRQKTDEAVKEEEEEEEDDDMKILKCERLASLARQGKDHVVSMGLDPTGKVMCCHGKDSSLEIFHVYSEDEALKHKQKRLKRARKKARDAGNDESGVEVVYSVEDDIRKITSVKMSAKIRSFDVFLAQNDTVKILALLTNNSLESCFINIEEKKSLPIGVSKLAMPGHRTDVRTLSFSSDNTAVLSASAESVKIWNRETVQCIRTMSCDYALCSMFVPGDRHIIVGTKTGKLQIFDLGAGTLLENVDAHDGAVWSICMAPDKKSIVSGSAAHEVKFWDFELISDEEYSTTSKRLTLVHTRTLKMSDDVLCLKYSPDHKLLAVSLLDNTVKVFFADTLKFFLSLYGHKLPVLCLDISSDSTLLVTGSADRNCKLWGLDFGDCHKSIFAHDDSIMCVQFVPKTHMFFTGGKDGTVKQWDGDSFDHVQTLKGHHSEVWSLAVSGTGNFVVSSSHDKSLRLWEKTDEPLVLEEEREMEREQEGEAAIGQGEEAVVAGETNKETGIAGKKTIETVKAAERIMEALELYKEENSKLDEHQIECERLKKQLPAPSIHPMFQAFKVDTPIKYMLEVIKKVKSSELEESLLVLPFSYVTDLLDILHQFIEAGWETELSCRCLFFLLKIHQGQITSNQMLLPVMEKLQSSTVTRVNQVRDTIGFNLAGLKFIQQQLQDKEKVTFFADATDRFKEKKRKAKKKVILTVKT